MKTTTKEKLIKIFEKNLNNCERLSATMRTFIGKPDSYQAHYLWIDKTNSIEILQSTKNNNDNLIRFISKSIISEPLTFGEYNRLLKLHHEQHTINFNKEREDKTKEKIKNDELTLKEIDKLYNK